MSRALKVWKNVEAEAAHRTIWLHITFFFSYEEGEMVLDSLSDQPLKDVETKSLSVRRINWSIHKARRLILWLVQSIYALLTGAVHFRSCSVTSGLRGVEGD